MCVRTPLLCKKGVALLQKGGIRTRGPEAGEEGRNGPAILSLKNFSQVVLASEIIPDSVLMVQSLKADHFFPI